MELVSSSSTLQILLLLLLVATNEAATFSITNNCSYTVWPAAIPLPGGAGKQLDPGQTWTLNVTPGTSAGCVWARTGCSFDAEGNRSCQTGDCGGQLACDVFGKPPFTVGEFALNQFDKRDLFSISLLHGFNVPMDFLPVPGQGCSKGPRCAVNSSELEAQCPSELKAPGGCNDACTALKEDKYCCGGPAANCEPTDYSLFFARMCPDAYTYRNNDTDKLFTCPAGINYQVVFCPQIDQTPSRPIGQPTSVRSSARSRVVLILAPVAGFILLVILFIIIFFVSKRIKQQRQEMEEDKEDFGELQGTPIRL